MLPPVFTPSSDLTALPPQVKTKKKNALKLVDVRQRRLPHAACLPFSRRRSEESPEGHSFWNRSIASHLFRGVFRRFRCPHCDDAVLHAGQEQSAPSGVQIRGLGGSDVRGGHWLFVCLVDKVGDSCYLLGMEAFSVALNCLLLAMQIID